MTDTVSPAKRSQMMSLIRSKDTKPELVIRKGLHRLGFRYRLHNNKLPGSPDLVFSKYNAICFIHGCFWHGHEDCNLYRLPKSRVAFWRDKIQNNKERDKRNIDYLLANGWRVCIIWECSIKGKTRLDIDELITIVANWIKSSNRYFHVRGN